MLNACGADTNGSWHQTVPAVAESTDSALLIRRHDNLRAGNKGSLPFARCGHDARHGWQVSWLAGRGAGWRQRIFLAFPKVDAARKGDDS